MMTNNTCAYTKNNKAPYPRVSYDAECGYQLCIMEGYKIGTSNERLSELNLPAGVCRKCGKDIAPTQSEASEPAEGGECGKCGGDGKQRDSVGLAGDYCEACNGSGYQPAASQQAPADLVGEALAKLRYAAKYASGPFRTTDEIDFWCGKVLDHADEIEQAFAQHKLRQATSPDAVIDEFVERKWGIKPHFRELLCQRCNLEYPVWFTANELWNATVRDGEHFFCLTCFAVLAEERGVIKPTAWKVEPESKRLDVTTDVLAEAREFFRGDDWDVIREAIEAGAYTHATEMILKVMSGFALSRGGRK